MATIDPRLAQLILERDSPAAGPQESVAAVGVAAESVMVEVLVRLRNQGGDDDETLAALSELGMRMRAKVSGPNTVVSGEIPLHSLPALEQMASVRRVEASRPLSPELDVCVPEVKAHIPHSATPPVRGAGAIIGIIDTGIDFRHPDFINPDGTSRVYRLWDQGARAVPGSEVQPYGYGREYTREQINAALNGVTPAADCVATDRDGHGTHVCGIAAGSGRARQTHLGLAPDSDLIVVALSCADSPTLGRSTHAFEAFDYVVKRAEGRPLAVNFSQGMNGGGHCGETVLETGLDNFARIPNVAIIKSAGNEQQMRIHAGGVLREGETRELKMEVRDGNQLDDMLEIWFSDEDEIGVELRPPGDAGERLVLRGAGGLFTTAAGNDVRARVEVDSEQTGDTATTVIISRGSAQSIQRGNWTLVLRAGVVKVGRFDAWIERTVRPGDEQTRFAEDSHDPTRTISIPGTARNIITVGAYVVRARDGTPPAEVAPFSGRGPTRYGQCKPELVAPGQVASARAGTQGTVVKRGTSMAAAVVTGAAALVMSQRDGLTCDQLKQILVRSARGAGPCGDGPDAGWGYGKLDVQAALEVAARAEFPKITDVCIEGATISWYTDIATTGAVRLLSNRRRLALGKRPHNVEDSSLSRSHQVTVAGLPAGKYFFQIVAWSKDGFSSEDDNGGSCYEINVEQRPADCGEALKTFKGPVSPETGRADSRLLREQSP
ncbi:MAG TPA: S8 family serine peptidase [Pyrinomonadaceae bacterium]|nr:S8 family serine peptidase [Pyrinomonadaceae bacterium]